MANLYGNLQIVVGTASNLANTDGLLAGNSDPYVIVSVDGHQVGRTKVIDNKSTCTFDQNFWYSVNGTYKEVKFQVYDQDVGISDDLLGSLKVDISDLKIGKDIDKEKELDETPKNKKSKLSFKISFKPITWEVHGVPFPIRKDCKLTLYQSAHTEPGDIPPLYGVEDYNAPACWEEMYRCITNAKHFIYITGWSVNVNISLIRPKDPSHPAPTIGEMLKKKADEGLVVLLHLWNEKSSMTSNSVGLMSTYDEETRAYFSNTKVRCDLSYRHTDNDATGTWIFTHHQKTIICDAEATDGKRRVIAFVGGLDLTKGRWDTPKKTLFRSLKGPHINDFYQVWTGVIQACGPREPWQDIHSKVEGPAARDVMYNFEQRWLKQAADQAKRLLKLDPKLFLTVKEEKIPTEDNWSLQLFRSIDHYSIPESPGYLEKGIQQAYINSIRRAEKFIYIENQYFLGSSPHWLSNKDTGALNEIPIELVRKIIQKIQNKEDFAVYVVIPMYPEGIPSDSAVQEILYWQGCTMRMMYSKIAGAIKESGDSDKSPTDYLNFFCLGNRESQEGSQGDLVIPPNHVDPIQFQTNLLKNRRYQIYVHSKMMVVDDNYIIVGSANINERSLSGNRDTEIAIGGYQPKWENSKEPRGEVHKFRMSLWAEHIGFSNATHVNPEKPECVKAINNIATNNWSIFTGPDVMDMPSHLMKYPIQVSNDGKVVANPEYIPDTTGKVLGCESALPNLLTI